RYKLDVLGADVGTFEVVLEAAQGADRERATLVARSRAKTSAFVSTNLGRFEPFVSTLLRADLTPVHFREELDEGDNHRSVDIDFPARGGKLPAKSTFNGKPDTLDLPATPLARDILSTFFLLRALPLKTGTPVCAEVYAARKMWALTGAVGPREQIETPLGKFNSVRIDTTATRQDDPGVKRTAHIWVTDDDRRLPLVAVGDVRGKTIRAQLVEAPASKLKTASTKHEPKTGSPRVGTSIGR
ncbi:MAG TPA: DUF3108 domain-containing protein, partial [Myxococcales bacterium]|nr:DUF3108 domain-containing protein [Myxococcales bacterium]